jgi:hypothetical protein
MLLLGIFPGEMEIYIHVKICIWINVQSSVTHSNPKLEQEKYPSVGEYLKKCSVPIPWDSLQQ